MFESSLFRLFINFQLIGTTNLYMIYVKTKSPSLLGLDGVFGACSATLPPRPYRKRTHPLVLPLAAAASFGYLRKKEKVLNFD